MDIHPLLNPISVEEWVEFKREMLDNALFIGSRAERKLRRLEKKQEALFKAAVIEKHARIGIEKAFKLFDPSKHVGLGLIVEEQVFNALSSEYQRTKENPLTIECFSRKSRRFRQFITEIRRLRSTHEDLYRKVAKMSRKKLTRRQYLIFSTLIKHSKKNYTQIGHLFKLSPAMITVEAKIIYKVVLGSLKQLRGVS